MSMSEMLKGVHAKVDVHEKAFTEARSWEAMIDAEHQRTLNLAQQQMEKLDKQLDRLDITLCQIMHNVVNPEDRSKMKAVRKYIYDIYEKTEELVEKI